MDEDTKEIVKQPPKRKRRITVRLAERRHQAAIVEKGGEFRCIPFEELDGDKVNSDVWDAGVPYGEKWEEMDFDVTAQSVADLWRKMGIWTIEELQARRNQAYQAVCGLMKEALTRDLRRRL